MLEQESGCKLESGDVLQFRLAVQSGDWAGVERLLRTLGISPSTLPTVQFMIREQKLLELLESGQTKEALQVLRAELSPLGVNQSQLHRLSSYMMCPSIEDLFVKAKWDGIQGHSRQLLLSNIQSKYYANFKL